MRSHHHSKGESPVPEAFVFDPWRAAILLVGGDKSGDWNAWYRWMIPRAEELFEGYLAERWGEKEGRE